MTSVWTLKYLQGTVKRCKCQWCQLGFSVLKRKIQSRSLEGVWGNLSIEREVNKEGTAACVCARFSFFISYRGKVSPVICYRYVFGIWRRRSSTKNVPKSERYPLWGVSLRIIKNPPVLGHTGEEIRLYLFPPRIFPGTTGYPCFFISCKKDGVFISSPLAFRILFSRI